MVKRALLLLGVTGSGKTRLAYEVARRYGGEVINLDRTYLYKGFPLTTGMQDALTELDVNRHLYQILDPQEESFSEVDFVNLVQNTVEFIHSINPNKLAIAEGGSTIYMPHIIDRNKNARTFTHVIGVKPPDKNIMSEKLRSRARLAIELGMIDEIKRNIAVLKSSFLIKHCHAAIPILNYLENHCTLDEAIDDIVLRGEGYLKRQALMLSDFPDVKWIDGSDLEKAIDLIGSELALA